jgi:hypothetical protein
MPVFVSTKTGFGLKKCSGIFTGFAGIKTKKIMLRNIFIQGVPFC